MKNALKKFIKPIFAIPTAGVLAASIPNAANTHSHKSNMGAHDQSHKKDTHTKAGVTVTSAWARATAGKASNGAAYISVANAGSKADRLIAVKGDVAKRMEIHTHLNRNGIMRMKKVDFIELPPDSRIQMKPGGYHVMLMGLQKPLKKGKLIPLILVFEQSGELKVSAEVMSVGAMHGAENHGVHKGH